LAAGLVGAGFTFIVGILVDRFSYKPAFLVAGLLPVVATVCVVLLIRTRHSSMQESTQSAGVT
jgi:MFS transporter, ACS family, hexuronate transporter